MQIWDYVFINYVTIITILIEGIDYNNSLSFYHQFVNNNPNAHYKYKPAENRL